MLKNIIHPLKKSSYFLIRKVLIFNLFYWFLLNKSKKKKKKNVFYPDLIDGSPTDYHSYQISKQAYIFERKKNITINTKILTSLKERKKNLTSLKNTTEANLISCFDCCCCMYAGMTEDIIGVAVSGEVTPTVIFCGFLLLMLSISRLSVWSLVFASVARGGRKI